MDHGTSGVKALKKISAFFVFLWNIDRHAQNMYVMQSKSKLNEKGME